MHGEAEEKMWKIEVEQNKADDKQKGKETKIKKKEHLESEGEAEQKHHTDCTVECVSNTSRHNLFEYTRQVVLQLWLVCVSHVPSEGGLELERRASGRIIPFGDEYNSLACEKAISSSRQETETGKTLVSLCRAKNVNVNLDSLCVCLARVCVCVCVCGGAKSVKQVIHLIVIIRTA